MNPFTIHTRFFFSQAENTEENIYVVLLSTALMYYEGPFSFSRLHCSSQSKESLSLQEALKLAKKKLGRPKLTWIQQIRNDLIECGMIPDSDFENVFKLANDGKEWRKAIVR